MENKKRLVSLYAELNELLETYTKIPPQYTDEIYGVRARIEKVKREIKKLEAEE